MLTQVEAHATYNKCKTPLRLQGKPTEVYHVPKDAAVHPTWTSVPPREFDLERKEQEKTMPFGAD